ncbi:MAG: hypothetical protein ACUVUR_00380, partial [bacterium]
VNPQDICEIGSVLRGAKTVVLQQFVPENARSPAYQKKLPYRLKDVEMMRSELAKFVGRVKLRGKFF